ncbi:MAG TPA: response regulator [Ktedonobacterales bacterium]|jgi:DNA-binding response OmpR family regulator
MADGSNYGNVRERSRATRTLADPDTFFTSDSGADEYFESPLVMVIDDSIAVRRVVEISLMRANISVISYPDGQTALQALWDGDVAPPRVLLLDIGMPRMNGYDVAKLLRSNKDFADTRIVMITSHDGVVDRARSLLIGTFDFIAKPFKSAELVRRVRRALGVLDPSAEWPE